MNTRSIRITFSAALLALLLPLAACGPGMGGSGTGQTSDPPVVGSPLPPSGANVTALCASELAPALACPSGNVVSPDAIARGTAPANFVGSVDDATPVRARLEGNRIEFTVGCTQWRFVGDWGAVAGQEPRFYGFINPGSEQLAATLQAQRDGTALWLTVRAADGTALYGPVRVTPAAAAPACS